MTVFLTSSGYDIDRIDIRRNPIKAKMKMGIIPETGNIYRDLTAKQYEIASLWLSLQEVITYDNFAIF